MSSIDIPTQASRFTLNELVIISKTGKIDISKIYEEINIFDSILSPVLSGVIGINDSVGLSQKLVFDGSEVLLVNIGKDTDSSSLRLKKAFRIYKQSERQNLTQNSEKYNLEFVSDEFIFSDQQRINQSYNATYSDIVKRILTDYLKAPSTKLNGSFENTSGIRDIVIPNLKPIEAIEWCAKRSVDGNKSPNYMFFENNIGFNYASLSSLLSEKELFEIKFTAKNMDIDRNAVEELLSPRGYEVINQADKIKQTRSGVNAGTFIGFDPVTRSVSTKKIGYEDHYNAMKHGNDTPNLAQSKDRNNKLATEAYDSKKSVSIFGFNRKNSAYIKKYDPTSLSKVETQEDFVFQRKAIISNLMNRRIKLTMPGNFQLTSGFNLNMRIPDFAIKETGNDDNEDRALSGKYLIIASRHIIGMEKHETVLEIASTSSKLGFIPQGTQDQNQQLKTYGSY